MFESGRTYHFMAPFTLEECKCAYISQPCFIGTSNAAGKRWPSGTPQCPPVQASHSLISAPTIRAKETTKGAVRNHLSGLCSLPPSAALSLLSPCPQEALALRGALVFAFLLQHKMRATEEMRSKVYDFRAEGRLPHRKTNSAHRLSREEMDKPPPTRVVKDCWGV